MTDEQRGKVIDMLTHELVEWTPRYIAHHVGVPLRVVYEIRDELRARGARLPWRLAREAKRRTGYRGSVEQLVEEAIIDWARRRLP